MYSRRAADLGKKARAAGILTRELQFSPHLFRRTYATMLYKGGMGLKGIQGKTRHANMEVLTRIRGVRFWYASFSYAIHGSACARYQKPSACIWK